MSDDDNPGDKPKRKPIGPFAIVSAEIYANRKIRKAKSLGCQVFVFALTRNAARGRTGVLDAAELEADYVADMLQISAQDAEEGVRLAIAAGLLLYEPETDTMHITGWDETWSRAPMTEAERERKASYRERKKNEKKNEKKESRPQTQNRDVRDKSRTNSGVCEPLSPAMSKSELEKAKEVMRTFAAMTGNGYSSRIEHERIVELLRRGYPKEHLEALIVWTCVGEPNWLNKTDRDGEYYMRHACTVLGLLAEKNLRSQMSAAVHGIAQDENGLVPADLVQRLQAFERARAAQ